MTELRDEIATQHGISDTDRDMLMTGTDEATLTAQAQRLANTPALTDGNRAPREGYSAHPIDPDRAMREIVRDLFGRTTY